MDLSWDDHRYFLAIARAQSLTAAGKVLGVSQPTVSRRLEAMESKLKVRLFDRTRRGYELTAIGTELFETVKKVEEDLAEAGRKIYGKDQALTGELRFTCTELFSERLSLAASLRLSIRASGYRPECHLHPLAIEPQPE